MKEQGYSEGTAEKQRQNTNAADEVQCSSLAFGQQGREMKRAHRSVLYCCGSFAAEGRRGLLGVTSTTSGESRNQNAEQHDAAAEPDPEDQRVEVEFEVRDRWFVGAFLPGHENGVEVIEPACT